MNRCSDYTPQSSRIPNYILKDIARTQKLGALKPDGYKKRDAQLSKKKLVFLFRKKKLGRYNKTFDGPEQGRLASLAPVARFARACGSLRSRLWLASLAPVARFALRAND